MLLREIILVYCYHVINQVLPSLIFCDDVVSFVNLKVVSDSKHLVASLADFLSIDLGDGELIRLIFIVASGN